MSATAEAPAAHPAPNARRAIALLSLAVGIVLADSAIVTLALPDIMRELGSEVGEVAWVLTGFNLVLALAAVPAAMVCARGATRYAGAVGLVVFAAASAGCALAGTMEVLIVSRAVQAIGGALVIAACLELLVAATGDERRGAARWAAAGVVGTAIGPVAGGLLTEAISWQSIFIIQVPLMLLAVPVALSLRPAPADQPGGPAARPNIPAHLALALVSAALTAALFLLVLLLVEGWSRSPATAALTVTAIPVAAFAAGALARALQAGTRAEAMAGSILIGGGLACLALLPAASPAWTIPAQLLIGLGLGLTVDSLTRFALEGRGPRALHGGWTIAARHGGIVLGLLILTPVFTADLERAEVPAKEAVVAQVLDADLSATSKLKLAEALEARLEADEGRVPDVSAAFETAALPGAEAAQAQALEQRVADQLERSATRAFRSAFLLAAALAFAALLPAFFLRDGSALGSRGLLFIGVAAALGAGLLGVQLASGGTSFEPQSAANPCQDRPQTPAKDLEGLAETVILEGLDQTACTLGVSRERLLLALPSAEARAELAQDTGTDAPGLARAIQDGLRAGVDELDRDGQLPSAAVLVPSVAAQLGVPENLVGLVPPSVIESLPPTADVLRTSVDQLDVEAILKRVDAGESLDAALREVLIESAVDAVRGQLEEALSGGLGALLG